MKLQLNQGSTVPSWLSLTGELDWFITSSIGLASLVPPVWSACQMKLRLLQRFRPGLTLGVDKAED